LPVSDDPSIINLMPLVQVLLFARYAELLGSSRVAVPLKEGTTVADLVEHLRSLPGGNSLPEKPFVAVNLAQAGYERQLEVNDEVALLPPMAGG